MTKNNVNRSSTFFKRVSPIFTLQRQYSAIGLKLRLRRNPLKQVLMVPAGVLLSAATLSAVMVTIVTFDVVVLLVSVFKKPFQRKKHMPFTSLRANV
ncbi:hypothetical protein [Hafnia psychrotolerans]|uniref:Uncharacterized protein n=1 Tax=Hafnia psychrotolerans TaxID=1477018 RepID=A0ABQ1GD21_9GAMM|nr:hypothetical protein [Hafnia psychrotolerans]GGA41222.1 hypothetical protein GCM10011328_15210 [Hafnia psychrotolerans]